MLISRSLRAILMWKWHGKYDKYWEWHRNQLKADETHRKISDANAVAFGAPKKKWGDGKSKHYLSTNRPRSKRVLTTVLQQPVTHAQQQLLAVRITQNKTDRR